MATPTTARTLPHPEFLGLTRDDLLRLLRQMLLIRRFEEKAAEMYQLGEIGGFCHLYIGQEAVAVGALSALRSDDYVVAAYREHGQALVRGVDARAVMAELFGRTTGTSKGKGGSMHIFDRRTHFLGGHAIVGAQIPLATGVGYAIRYRNEDRVCLCFMGDAAVNGGAFHEALNLAALWGLPVIYFIENNLYGMGTAVDRAAAIERLADRACAYEGMEGWTVDGQDVLAVREAVERAVRRAREETRPTLIEAICYRYMGHSMADKAYGVYRGKDEVLEWQEQKDPITLFVRRLKDAELIEDAGVQALDRAVRAEVEAAVEFARSSPLPAPEALYDDVYVDPGGDPRRRRDPWR